MATFVVVEMRKSLPYTKLNHSFLIILHLWNHFNYYADLPYPYLHLITV